ncbi:MAG: hypothetical protein G01um101438_991 [Parcubacteria group bacterium Gr01-1014_38]|nr:MAG: hypothetical protein G01um101438_991 [Parcubacteria group bacterium Gr01-1014_38]
MPSMMAASPSASAAPPVLGRIPARRDEGEGFSLPPIRTMADDLADAARGALTGTGGLPQPLPSGAAAAGVPVAAQATGLVRLPAGTRPRSRALPVLLLLLVFLALIGVGAWAALRLLPLSSGTVADAVPAEAQAFVSVRNGDAQSIALRSALLSSVGGLQGDQLRGATDLTYLLLPGPSAAEPVAALLVRGVQTVDLSATPSLGVKPVAGGVLITESTNLGRVNALSGSTWGRERAFRTALRGFPENPSVFLAFRPGALATFLQPFSSHALPAESPLVMAIVPTGDDGSASVVARIGSVPGRAEQTPAAPTGGDGVALARKLPQTTLLAIVRPVAALEGFVSPTSASRLSSGLRPILQALHERAAALKSVLQSFEGVLALGVLPTETSGVRDLVAVVPLKAGSDPSPQLRELESAGPTFGPYLTGSAFADAAFTETDYQGVRMRYMNFGSPARALDYAVVDQTLLLATSRASMRAVIDAARGVTPPLGDSDVFGSLAGVVDGSNWVFFRGGPVLREEFPPAYRALVALLNGLFLRPASPDLLTGAMVLQEPIPSEPVVGAPPSPSPGVQPGVP